MTRVGLIGVALLASGCADITVDPPPGDAGALQAPRDGDAASEGAPAAPHDVSDGLTDTLRPESAQDIPPPEQDCSPGEPRIRAADTEDDAPEATPSGPPLIVLTVNEVPASMNGSQPWTDQSGEAHPFTLRVNHQRFTLDVLPASGSGPIDWSTLSVACDQPLVGPDGDILVAQTLMGTEVFESVDGGRYHRLLVTPDNAALSDVTVQCTADVTGPEGTATSAITFDTATLPPHLDPFEAPDTWLIVLSRDIARLEHTVHADGTMTLVSEHVPEGDGVPDLEEAFIAMGLFSETNDAAKDYVKGQLLEVVRSWAYQTFLLAPDGTMTPESIPVHVVFEGDPGAPDPATWDGSFSMIALGGDGEPEDQANGTVGMARLDPNNQSHEDNTVYGLGIFTTGVVRQALGNPLAALLLASILPHSGTPIGDGPNDALFLSPDFDPQACHDSALLDRFTILGLALEFIGLALGSTLAHEIGHSIGLVPPGPPPQGLFAGVSGLSFTDHTLDDAHIDTPGLNVMQTGKVTNWLEALSQDPTFNALNTAYLRRRLVVGE
jgi:hypothetical protein